MLRWPHQTQLVRIGGDDLGVGDVVNLEFQEEGYQVDEELDAAVDFLSPIQSGRCVILAFDGPFGSKVWATSVKFLFR
jgi:hypothetical protein